LEEKVNNIWFIFSRTIHLKIEKNNFSLLAPGESVKDFEQSVSFGISFIFSLFLSGLSGYYFGVYCLGFDTNKVNINI